MGIRRHSVIVALLVLALAAGCERAATPPGSKRTAGADPVVDVVTALVRRGGITQSISAPGSLVARRESRIGAEVQARIRRVYVSEGDRVEAGAPLFELDPEIFEAALRQADAGLDLARAERGKAESDLRRARALREQNILAEDEVERLTTALAVARAREREAREAVALARQNLDRTVVSAPYAGSIAERLADEGTTALVQPQTIIVVLQETAELEARAAIPESQLALVRLGDAALIHVEGFPEPVRTTVSAVSDTIDPATRTYLVKMRVPNADRRLKAGVFAHVEILPQVKPDAVLVPREAIRTEDGRDRVLVVRDGRVVAVPIEVGVVSEREAEVLSGVDPDEVVIVGEAARTIAPHMRVRVVPAAEDASS
jgi:membrane fusion protein, multidrug efflux system